MAVVDAPLPREAVGRSPLGEGVVESIAVPLGDPVVAENSEAEPLGVRVWFAEPVGVPVVSMAVPVPLRDTETVCVTVGPWLVDGVADTVTEGVKLCDAPLLTTCENVALCDLVGVPEGVDICVSDMVSVPEEVCVADKVAVCDAVSVPDVVRAWVIEGVADPVSVPEPLMDGEPARIAELVDDTVAEGDLVCVTEGVWLLVGLPVDDGVDVEVERPLADCDCVVVADWLEDTTTINAETWPNCARTADRLRRLEELGRAISRLPE